MAKQELLDKTYLDMAEVLSKLSYAEKAKVGCLIVKDTHIIAEGINGTPAGFDNCCEYEKIYFTSVELDSPPVIIKEIVTKPEVLHAESNAITKIARSTQSSEGSTLYTTLSPCLECSKLIIQAGIKRVVYKNKYRITNGLELLKKANIEVIELI